MAFDSCHKTRGRGVADANVRTHFSSPVVKTAAQSLPLWPMLFGSSRSPCPGSRSSIIAGCYHCGTTLVCAAALGHEEGVKIRRLDFSDPQGGKGHVIGRLQQ